MRSANTAAERRRKAVGVSGSNDICGCMVISSVAAGVSAIERFGICDRELVGGSLRERVAQPGPAVAASGADIGREPPIIANQCSVQRAACESQLRLAVEGL